MSESKLNITNSMSFVCNKYESLPTDVSIDYTNFSSDHWHGDEEKSIEINKEKAIEIIAFLSESFDLTNTGERGYE